MPSDDKELDEKDYLYQTKSNRGLEIVSETVMKFFCLIENHCYHFGRALSEASASGQQTPNRLQAVNAACQDCDIAFDWACFTTAMTELTV